MLVNTLSLSKYTRVLQIGVVDWVEFSCCCCCCCFKTVSSSYMSARIFVRIMNKLELQHLPLQVYTKREV